MRHGVFSRAAARYDPGNIDLQELKSKHKTRDTKRVFDCITGVISWSTSLLSSPSPFPYRTGGSTMLIYKCKVVFPTSGKPNT
jgi:hypothetical protein